MIAWYELRDLPAGTQVIGDQNNQHLGVLSPAGEPKPAFQALTRAVALLSGPLRPLAVQVRAVQVRAIEARAFQRADGRCLIVAWLPTHTLPDSAGEIRAAFTLAARTRSRKAHTSDAYGEAATELALANTSPVVTAELTLSPERTHVIEIDACE